MRPKKTTPSPGMPAIALLAVVLTLGGCAGLAPAVAPATTAAPRTAPASPTAPGPAAVERSSASTAALAIEQRWLAAWFRGTPVLIAQRDDGAVVVDVPREFCFDRNRSHVKPALAAVLDKVAESLRRRPTAQLVWLAAPDDLTGTTPLALQRAAQVRKHLRDRGVPVARLGEPMATSVAAVQLRIEAAPH